MGGKDLVGRPASEEEVAKGLGFNSVEEFRRWDTETGRKAAEAEHAMRQAKDEADRFRWHGRRMEEVLKKAEEMISAAAKEPAINLPVGHYDRLLLAMRVVLGKEVDWKNVLNDWLYPDGKQLDGKTNVFAENDRLRDALRRMWEWQRTCQELLPDDLTDDVKKLLGIE